MMSEILIIGYGNPLCGDDGLGPAIVAELAALALPGVRTRITHQLLPELAADLALAAFAIFVDAYKKPAKEAVTVTPIGPSESASFSPHVVQPESLLAMTRSLYAQAPKAWVVSVEGETFEMGEALSAVARANAWIAVAEIRALISTCSSP
jgi:hydrogenase maturation protease